MGTRAGRHLRRIFEGSAGGERGVIFIWVLVSLFVLAVLLMAAVQPASIVMHREREKELVFRGEEYTEAIRRYMMENHGTFPTHLKDLMKPGGPKRIRYMRHLYSNPFARDGKWGLLAPGTTIVTIGKDGKPIYTPQGGGPMSSSPGSTTPPKPPTGGAKPPVGKDTGGSGGTGAPDGFGKGTLGHVMVLPFRLDGKEGQPILGVYCKLHEKAFQDFRSKKYYDEWFFSPLVIPPPMGPRGPVQPGGTPQNQQRQKPG
jgi:type II secretory pathway pseudopilin PulG